MFQKVPSPRVLYCPQERRRLSPPTPRFFVFMTYFAKKNEERGVAFLIIAPLPFSDSAWAGACLLLAWGTDTIFK